jgi:hypothetical protein
MPIARVYLIENHGKGYVGSTTDTIQRRLVKHRCSKKLWERGNHGHTSAIDLIDGNETIRLLEEFEYTTKKEMRIREQHYINTLPNLVNNINALAKDLTEYYAEWRKTNKEYKNEYNRNRKRRNKLFVEFLRDFNL